MRQVDAPEQGLEGQHLVALALDQGHEGQIGIGMGVAAVLQGALQGLQLVIQDVDESIASPMDSMSNSNRFAQVIDLVECLPDQIEEFRLITCA